MQDSDVYRELTNIFRDVFMKDELEIKPEFTAKDVPGWDSFKQIEIILAVEEKFGIKFHTKDLDSLHNVGDLARTMLAKIGSKVR